MGGASQLRGPIVGVVGKSADKVYYDRLLSRPSTYRGIFEERHSSGRAEENQRDVPHTRAKAKSDALDNGGALAGVRFLIFPPIPPHHTQPYSSFPYSPSRVPLTLSKPSPLPQRVFPIVYARFYPRMHKRDLPHIEIHYPSSLFSHTRLMGL